MTDEWEATPSTAKSLADRVTPPVVYRLPGMDLVRVIPNLKYTDTDNPHLLMDVYVPADLEPNERRPVVLLIHGGAGPETHPKDWGIFKSWSRLLASSGMTAVAFTHRYSPPPQSLLPEAAADMRSAIDYVRAHAESLHVDSDRIGVCAWSSGGALLSDLLNAGPRFMRCLVALFPLLDLQQYSPPGDAGVLQFLKRFSAIESLPEDGSNMAPMMIVRAGRDEVPTLNDALDRFVGRALAANAPMTLINHPSGKHGFDNQQDDEATREIIRAVLEFLRTHLRLE